MAKADGKPSSSNRKPAYEKKNPGAHADWKQRNRERNAAKGKQELRGFGEMGALIWVRNGGNDAAA